MKNPRHLLVAALVLPGCGDDSAGNDEAEGADASSESGASESGAAESGSDECAGQIEVHEGDLAIDAATDTTQFECLREVTGELEVWQFPGEDLWFLSNLQRVGMALSIQGNPHLRSLDGLDALTDVGEWVIIADNELLVDLESLGAIRNVERVFISRNGVLQNVASLSGDFRRSDGVPTSLQISGNDSLENIDGLAGVTGFDSVTLLNNPKLHDIAGLRDNHEASDPSLYELVIQRNPALRELAGLENLVEAQEINLATNVALANLDGLSALRRVSTLMLTDLPALENIDGLRNLERIEQELNFGGCNPEDDAPAGSPLITSLAGFDSLTYVHDFRFGGHTRVTSLAGAEALTQVNRMLIVRNPLLSSAEIDAFASRFELELQEFCGNLDDEPCLWCNVIVN